MLVGDPFTQPGNRYLGRIQPEGVPIVEFTALGHRGEQSTGQVVMALPLVVRQRFSVTRQCGLARIPRLSAIEQAPAGEVRTREQQNGPSKRFYRHEPRIRLQVNFKSSKI